MTWPLPAPGDIADRAASVFEAEMARIYALRNPGLPPAVVDARSPNSTLAVHGRVLEISAWDLYLYQARSAQELMVDTAIDNLPRHGAIWGVPQDQPAAAFGNLVIAGAPGTNIPIGQAFTAPGGASYATTVAQTIGAGGTISQPVAASLAGSAGNLPTGTVLTLVSPIAGLNPQTGTVDANGITGGRDLETADSWRARIIQRIQKRGGGGDGADYVEWSGEVLPNAIVAPRQMALGVVQVVVVGQGAGQPVRVPTASELAILTAYLNDAYNRKPLGMSVVVTPATLVPLNVTLTLSPDTTVTEAAATSALQLWMLADASAGCTLYGSRMDAALSNADGETYHERIAPPADVTYGVTQWPVLGVVSFVA